jgi:hypothetical protein
MHTPRIARVIAFLHGRVAFHRAMGAQYADLLTLLTEPSHLRHPERDESSEEDEASRNSDGESSRTARRG